MKALVGCLLGIAPCLGIGQVKAQPSGPIVTDRPDFTESAVVVPFLWVQIETGLTYQWTRQSFSLSLPETLFRISTGQKSELRLGLPDFGWTTSNGSKSSGIGDTYIGAKFQLGPFENGDDFALIPAVTLPSKKSGFSSGTVDPELKVCWGRALSDVWGISAMAYGLYTSDNIGRVFVFQQTVSFGKAVSERSGVFFEYAGTFATRTMPAHVAHVGVVYRTSPNTQIDLHSGFTMNGSDREPFLAAGYSIRF